MAAPGGEAPRGIWLRWPATGRGRWGSEPPIGTKGRYKDMGIRREWVAQTLPEEPGFEQDPHTTETPRL